MYAKVKITRTTTYEAFVKIGSDDFSSIELGEFELVEMAPDEDRDTQFYLNYPNSRDSMAEIKARHVIKVGENLHLCASEESESDTPTPPSVW